MPSFAYVVLEYHVTGRPDEVVFFPICSACGDVILDSWKANIVFLENTDRAPEPIGEVNGVPITRLPGEVDFLHKSCDHSRGGKWKTLDRVLKSDQRYEVEKD